MDLTRIQEQRLYNRLLSYYTNYKCKTYNDVLQHVKKDALIKISNTREEIKEIPDGASFDRKVLKKYFIDILFENVAFTIEAHEYYINEKFKELRLYDISKRKVL